MTRRNQGGPEGCPHELSDQTAVTLLDLTELGPAAVASGTTARTFSVVAIVHDPSSGSAKTSTQNQTRSSSPQAAVLVASVSRGVWSSVSRGVW
jgi:hypothetical protein